MLPKPCCQNRVHRHCLRNHIRTSSTYGLCQASFPDSFVARHRAPTAVIPEDEMNETINQFDNALPQDREQLRMQAIAELEQLLRPGVLEARIRDVFPIMLLFLPKSHYNGISFFLPRWQMIHF